MHSTASDFSAERSDKRRCDEYSNSSKHNLSFESKEIWQGGNKKTYSDSREYSRDSQQSNQNQSREPRNYNERQNFNNSRDQFTQRPNQAKDEPRSPIPNNYKQETFQRSNDSGRQAVNKNTNLNSMKAGNEAPKSFQSTKVPRDHKEVPALPSADKLILNTKPQAATKQGNHRNRVSLQTNYYRLPLMPQHDFVQYRVDFKPELESTVLKKGLIKSQKEKLGGYLFDGTCLYVTRRLHTNPMVLMTKTRNDELIEINIKEVSVVSKTSHIAIQLMNLVIKQAMEGLQLQLVNRNFFDAKAKVSFNLLFIKKIFLLNKKKFRFKSNNSVLSCGLGTQHPSDNMKETCYWVCI